MAVSSHNQKRQLLITLISSWRDPEEAEAREVVAVHAEHVEDLVVWSSPLVEL